MTETPDVSRRRLFQGAAGGFAVGALGGAGAALGWDRESPADKDSVDLTKSYTFYDQDHPVGIQTHPQRYVVFMTFDMVSGSTVTDVQTTLAQWSAAASQLMQGKPIGQVQPTGQEAVATDTGEAQGLDAASLTITIGLGPSLFDSRFGLASKKPKLLKALPQLPSDNLQAGLTGGDFSVQACADDPQVAYHAIRNLARQARETVNTRWTVMGFGRASAGEGQQTPRNLLGFKDGTRNIEHQPDFDQHVWIDEAGWMQGGSYQVARKIQMNIEIWDADRVSDQENVFGRSKAEGAPLSGHKEFDTPNFSQKASGGDTAINPNAHIALAAHENNNGVKILRRSYNYTDGINGYGQLDAGLLFLAYMKDPDYFVQLQTKLGQSDLLNEYITHIGSGIFAIPPAPKAGHYIAEQLFS